VPNYEKISLCQPDWRQGRHQVCHNSLAPEIPIFEEI
jgi:hypothetical protein